MFTIERLEARSMFSADTVLRWNELLLESLSNQPPRVPLARNLALVHVATFDAINAIDRSYKPYATEVKASRGASQQAAAAQAAHDTLSALYPSRQEAFDAALAEDLADIPPGRARQGIAIGHEVARQILERRADDGASAIVNYTPPNSNPGQWQPTAPNFAAATNVQVPLITPFAVESSSQFRPGPPPSLTSAEYAQAYNEVKTLGRATNSTRTADQTLVAGLWRLPLNNHLVWNRIAQDMAREREGSLVEDARLFALMNVALNDALQTSNESKFHYALWRPITAIRRGDEDNNPATDTELAWMTLHPTTPPYPTYAGNAATIGATCASILADDFGDSASFDIDWSRYGFTGVTRSYDNFDAAADEMAWSRVYGGIHFRFDNAAGQQVGANVAAYVTAHLLLPAKRGDAGDHVVTPTCLIPSRTLWSENTVQDDETEAGLETATSPRFWPETAAGTHYRR